MSNMHDPISRRRALVLGGGIAGGLAIAPGTLLGTARAASSATPAKGQLPVKDIEGIMRTTGMVMDGVLTIELDRDDLHVMGPQGVPFKPSFEENHTFSFQPLANGMAFLNAELSLLPSELNPVIDKIITGGLVFMAEHQHFFNENPQTWHIHFRGMGDPLQLARAAIAVVRATGTPLPQTQPSNPKTSLPKDQLAHILGGSAQVGGSGVVTVSIPRAETIVLGGVAVKPEMGVSVTVAFEPLANGQAACAPDYALIASEVNPAIEASRDGGFTIHCLYNQETDERPQLYFSHNLAVGNAVDLAGKVAKVLDKMNVKRS